MTDVELAVTQLWAFAHRHGLEIGPGDQLPAPVGAGSVLLTPAGWRECWICASMLAEIVVTSRPGRRTIKTGRDQKSLKLVHLELPGAPT